VAREGVHSGLPPHSIRPPALLVGCEASCAPAQKLVTHARQQQAHPGTLAAPSWPAAIALSLCRSLDASCCRAELCCSCSLCCRHASLPQDLRHREAAEQHCQHRQPAGDAVGQQPLVGVAWWQLNAKMRGDMWGRLAPGRCLGMGSACTGACLQCPLLSTATSVCVSGALQELHVASTCRALMT
jgi:hypothetical protein